MADIKIQRGGTMIGATSDFAVLRALAQDNCRRVSGAITPVTNNSGGTAGTGITVRPTLTNEANAATNLAQKAATETALGTVLDALGELATKANATATALGITGFTNNAGGTTPDGTIGAVTVSTTAATTGVVKAATETTLDLLDDLQYQVFLLVNKLAGATGVTTLTSNYVKATSATVAAITISGGTAADPGVTKVAIDAALTAYRANIKTLATTLIAVNTVAVPKVLAV